ncbi:hypothetical protein H4R35_002331 [Dimargaris xerosporica]|nr:hypothetical protein H4R35_002331 [Dimargaris xerosporica]
MRCKFCKREGSASFDPPQVTSYDAEHNGQFSRIAVLECRGLEPVEFEARSGWKAVGVESGQIFDEIDLTDGDWADYDEKANNEVSVMDLEFQFSRA